jgi:hypothetical protein
MLAVIVAAASSMSDKNEVWMGEPRQPLLTATAKIWKFEI